MPDIAVCIAMEQEPLSPFARTPAPPYGVGVFHGDAELAQLLIDPVVGKAGIIVAIAWLWLSL
ncbi:MAG: hypothetical protein KDD10_07655 [Phaeodactylibacter sp.]|nr:hypothetical protein [Phaeodactylibacter sp.]MCB9297171.1 hypothetical protein [Lewinellaceae bacterium]